MDNLVAVQLTLETTMKITLFTMEFARKVSVHVMRERGGKIKLFTANLAFLFTVTPPVVVVQILHAPFCFTTNFAPIRSILG